MKAPRGPKTAGPRSQIYLLCFYYWIWPRGGQEAQEAQGAGGRRCIAAGPCLDLPLEGFEESNDTSRTCSCLCKRRGRRIFPRKRSERDPRSVDDPWVPDRPSTTPPRGAAGGEGAGRGQGGERAHAAGARSRAHAAGARCFRVRGSGLSVILKPI